MALPTNVLSLFSGGGGLELGIRRALPGSRVVCHVERETYAAATLVARMADASLDQAPVWDDVTTFDGRPWRGVVDLIAGGFPCQDISNAGKREGITGSRSGLWKHYARVISEVEPEWVFVENVSALAARGLDTVLADLTGLGYSGAWITVRASDAGAPHRRNRLFILAHRDGVERDEPTSTDSKASGAANYSTESGRHSGTTLTDAAARNWATPSARDWKSGKASQATHDRNARPLNEQATGLPDPTTGKHGHDLRLNPRFVEWLMGWPDGWSDCGC